MAAGVEVCMYGRWWESVHGCVQGYGGGGGSMCGLRWGVRLCVGGL